MTALTHALPQCCEDAAIVDRVVDAASGTFGIRLEIPNPGNRIPAGLKCKVRFSGNGR
jgi:multidrug efflux pump subunit AcrA (membrane-fusion protein)